MRATKLVPTWSAMVARWRGVTAPAVITHDDQWSGDELLDRAAGAADWLDEIGAPRGQPVAALVVSTASAFAVAIGATGSHRPLAPLGPRLTAREIASCVAGLGVRLLVADPEYAAVARQVGAMTGAEIAELPVPRVRRGPSTSILRPRARW